MNMKRASVAALGVILAGAAGFAGWQWWRTPAPETANVRAARALSASIVAGLEAAEEMLEPYRCARALEASDDHPQTLHVGAGTERREAHLSGHRLRLAVAAGRPLRVAFVADARGTVETLARIRDQLASRPAARSVDLVVSLGGMARDRQGIEAALSALTGPWFLIALPGDRESYGEHRSAIAALAKDDKGVIDGASARVIELADAATLVTLPGVSHRARSLAGVDACVYTDEDVANLGALLTRPPANAEPGKPESKAAPRVLLSHAPPRQRGTQATDRSPAGVNMGERALTQALTQAGIGLAVHGLVAPTTPSSGKRRVALDPARPIILSAGAADGMVDVAHGTWPPRALVITLASGSVTWTYLEE